MKKCFVGLKINFFIYWYYLFKIIWFEVEAENNLHYYNSKTVFI